MQHLIPSFKRQTLVIRPEALFLAQKTSYYESQQSVRLSCDRTTLVLKRARHPKLGSKQYPTASRRSRAQLHNNLPNLSLLQQVFFKSQKYTQAQHKMASYTSTPLFGGALIVDLPSTFADVRCVTPFPSTNVRLIHVISTIRQVPDHQEVYLDKDGFTSIIFDITERVGLPGRGPAVDGAALTTHLEDIVASDIDTVQVWNTSNTQFSKLPYAFFSPLSLLKPLANKRILRSRVDASQ
jgi:hypothetical protein